MYSDDGYLQPGRVFAFIVLIMMGEVALVWGGCELISWLVRS